jgi:hypothetical protein
MKGGNDNKMDYYYKHSKSIDRSNDSKRSGSNEGQGGLFTRKRYERLQGKKPQDNGDVTMIKLRGLQSVDTTVKSTFTPEVRTYNIVSGRMSDECKPYRVAQHAMFWLDDEGFLGELECIYPKVVEQAYCHYSDTLVPRNGFPQFEVLSTDSICAVQHQGNSFTVWFSKDKTIDDEIVSENVHFLFAGDELVGIKADQISIIEDSD